MKSNTKDLILQSSIDLFAAKGFNASTTSEIARKAGVAEVTVFRHYKSKKDILLAVLERFVGIFCREIVLRPIDRILETNKDKSTKEVLKIMLKDRIELIEKNSDVIWIIITEMKYHPELKDRIIKELGPNALKLMGRALCQDCNDILSQYDTEVVFRTFLGTVMSVILYHKVLPEVFTITKAMEESIDEAVEILLHGISNK